MFNPFGKGHAAAALAACLVLSPMAQPVHGAVIGTQTALELEDRKQRIDQVDALLARDSVRELLIDMGVDPDAARSRVSTLTDAELAVLADELDRVPAGGTGVIEVVGIVAVVLLVLELLGVTDVFTRI